MNNSGIRPWILSQSMYSSLSCWAHSFPREWIKGDGYPAGIDRNTELSPRDKEHVRRLYGPPRISPGDKSVPPPIPPTQPQKSESSLALGSILVMHGRHTNKILGLLFEPYVPEW